MNPLLNLPSSIRERSPWVLWRKETRNGKPTKVPLSTSGTPASVSDPSTWATFAEVLRAYESRPDLFAGISFMIREEDGFIGVDLDHVIGEHGVEPWALGIVLDLVSYTEYSQSGTGLHVLCRGKLEAEGCRRGQVEIYRKARFFIATGNRFPGMPEEAEERSAELAKVHARYVARKVYVLASVPSAPVALGDRELIDRALMSRQGAKFGRLWSGDTSGYTSRSEADLALCSMLAFWTGNDPARIERLFSSSGLVREKWVNREDYRQATIRRAVSTTSETFLGA